MGHENRREFRPVVEVEGRVLINSKPDSFFETFLVLVGPRSGGGISVQIRDVCGKPKWPIFFRFWVKSSLPQTPGSKK